MNENTTETLTLRNSNGGVLTVIALTKPSADSGEHGKWTTVRVEAVEGEWSNPYTLHAVVKVPSAAVFHEKPAHQQPLDTMNTTYPERKNMFQHILDEVNREVTRSTEKHGTQRDVPLGTGPDELPLNFTTLVDGEISAAELAEIAKETTDSRSRQEGDGSITWRDILTEEVFEAYAEKDLEKLRAELIQVAAVAVKMVDAVDAQSNLYEKYVNGELI